MGSVCGLTELYGEYSMEMSDEELKRMIEAETRALLTLYGCSPRGTRNDRSHGLHQGASGIPN